ncbi:phosphoribosylanthranilate isomerase [Eubacterium sp. 1001713B170207_170306_E7]|uniref:phosphoribosylanthranilate isomerase n=1 Tax=Eubacterium sp. 1001713B170207_170306_E7 TaxID=2787097 RepID=UPI00189B3E34|nr:phosphoribosylanthranilate isomerase [Eubacterium sp. 1001713B170207_170306_E7]
METKIKICGLTRPQDIEAVNAAKPDYVGFVFAESSRRLTPQQALALKRQLTPEIQSVGVFVNASLETIQAVTRQGILDLVQLHGDESPGFAERVRCETGCPVVKALRIKDAESLEALEDYAQADYLLLDAYNKNSYGGTGRAFNWELLRESTIQKPFFLAGGLNEENIGAAIKTVKPFAVDISSGVETNGCKDPGKIEEIIKKIRRSDQ